ncbi:LysE family translocator [Mesorhizobium onobrychidis]|uniref:LysE family translocator n=1 Tax=Mesorhizobium onobrychidis TaxID=2775404 RepID=A0ABY5R761_9HYPH|nr:LysE family translocator [Mesorhizobium onobrychidis]
MQAPPGPDSMLVTARGISHGRSTAFFTVLGMTVGAGLVQLPLLALGVSSLVGASPLAFSLLRLSAAAYLCWLGLSLLRSSWHAGGDGDEGLQASGGQSQCRDLRCDPRYALDDLLRFDARARRRPSTGIDTRRCK